MTSLLKNFEKLDLKYKFSFGHVFLSQLMLYLLYDYFKDLNCIE